MIDLASENLLTLEQAAEKLLVTKQIVMRWIRTGSRGVKLEAIRFGTHWRTSEEALQRFGNRSTPNKEPAPPTISPSFRQRQNEVAKAALELAFGIRKCETCKKVIKTQGRRLPMDEKLWCPQCLIKVPSSTISQRIRSFRWDAELTQGNLCAMTGFSLQLLRDFETGKKAPTKEQMEKLVTALGTDLAYGLDA